MRLFSRPLFRRANSAELNVLSPPPSLVVPAHPGPLAVRVAVQKLAGGTREDSYTRLREQARGEGSRPRC